MVKSKFKMKWWQAFKEKVTLAVQEEEEKEQADEKGVKGEELELVPTQTAWKSGPQGCD